MIRKPLKLHFSLQCYSVTFPFDNVEGSELEEDGEKAGDDKPSEESEEKSDNDMAVINDDVDDI